MKALTVQQPWASAMFWVDPKDIENRTQAWGYRGPLAIHAGARWSDRGGRSPLIVRHPAYPDAPVVYGAIIGVVDLVDVHLAQHRMPGSLSTCCDSPWAETSYNEYGTRRVRRDIVHLVLEHPRPLAEPIPCRGALGLWTPPVEVRAQIEIMLDAADWINEIRSRP